MANFEDKNKEQLAEAERLLRDKSNTLGKDGSVLSEPFAKINKISSADILMHAPSAAAGLTTPEYDDYPSQGAVGTRHTTTRLHSYLPSGLEGPSSAQTFMTVFSPPIAQGPSNIEEVRIKPLISPKYSQGKANAAHGDPNFRGFELALYPAMSTGGAGSPLVADTSKGPISPAADPSAGPPDEIAAGIGDEGFWTVDYDAGIVRFSHPPLNGSNGIMNPNNVFSDIEGLEVASDAYGAITMFATFYHYTGEFGTPENLSFMTVGDGYVSQGIFTGADHNAIQAAINSLPENGGTVFIKEGTYTFLAPVLSRQNVNVVGLGGVKIRRPVTEAAFVINDGYVTIEGIEIQPHGSGSVVIEGGAIEITNTDLNQELKNITIKNCVLYGEDDAYAIAINAISDCQITNLTIANNLFEHEPESTNPIYIGDRSQDRVVSLVNCDISNNAFQPSEDTNCRAIEFKTAVIRIQGLIIANNKIHGPSTGNPSVLINVGTQTGGFPAFSDIRRLIVTNNYVYDFTITCNQLQYTVIDSNTILNDLKININSNLFDVIISDNNVDRDINIELVGSFLDAFGLSITGNSLNRDILVGYNSPGEMIQCAINDNIFGFLGCVRLEQSVISGNSSDDGIEVNSFSTTTMGLESSSITNNSVGFGYIQVNGAATPNTTTVCLNSIIADNDTLIDIDINGLVTESTITGNSTISGSLLMGNVTSSTVIANNSLEFGSITATLLSNSVISNNRINSNSIIITSTSITSSVIEGNEIGSLVNFTGTTVSELVFSNNIIGSTATFGDAITKSVISGNVFKSTATFTDAVTEDINATEIVGNNFGGSVTINGKFLDSVFTDGYVSSSLTFGDIVTNSNISNNRVRDALSIASASTVYNSQLNSNIVLNSSMTVGSNVFNTVISNNRATSFTLGTLNKSEIVSNIGISGGLSSGSISNNSIINNNTCVGFTSGTISDSTFDANRFSSSWTSGAISNCALSDNLVDGAFTISSGGDFSNSHMSNNVISGNMLWSTVTVIDSIFSNNTLGNSAVGAGWTISEAFTNNILMGNRISSISVNEIVDQCLFCNNYIESFTGNNLIQRTIFADGYFTNIFNVLNASGGNATAAMKDCEISGNFFGGQLFINSSHATALTVDGVNISNNFILSSIDIGPSSSVTNNIRNLVIASNSVETGIILANSSLSASTVSCSNVSITDNKIGDAVVSGAMTINGHIIDSKIVGNSVGLALTADFITGVDLSSNTFTTVVTDTMNESIFSNNRVLDTATFGSVSSTMTDCTFSGNFIATNMDFNGLLDRCIVSDNNIVSSFLADTINDTQLMGNQAATNGVAATHSISFHSSDGYLSADGNHLFSMANLLPNVSDQELGSLTRRWTGRFSNVNALGLGNTPAITATAGTDGYGGLFTGTNNNAGIVGVGGSADGDGVVGIGAGAGAGVYGFGGGFDGAGVRGIGSQDGYGGEFFGSRIRSGVITYGDATRIISPDINGLSQYVSEDGGVTWRSISSPWGSVASSPIAYNGKDLWAQGATAGQIAVSRDGLTWVQTVDSFFGPFGSNAITCIGYAKGLWVAGAVGGQVGYSKDAVDWTVSTISGSQPNALAFGNGLWVIVGTSGMLFTSPDGINWTSRTSGFGATSINTVAHNNKDLWVIAGNAGTLAVSEDGITWTLRTSGFGANAIIDVAHNGKDLWVAVGVGPTITTSPDGDAWTVRTNPFAGSIDAVIYNGKDLWIATQDSSSDIATSPDGIVWTVTDSIRGGQDLAVLYGSNAGAIAHGSQYNGTGIQGYGHGYQGIGVEGFGEGSGAGVVAQGGYNGGTGVIGYGGLEDGYGGKFFGGDVNGGGIYTVGDGVGAGIVAVGGSSGYGAILSATAVAPVRSALRMIPQDQDPSTAVIGDFYANSVTGKINGYNGDTWDRYVPQSFSYVGTGVSTSGTGSQILLTFTPPADSWRLGSSIRVRAATEVTAQGGGASVTHSIFIAGTQTASINRNATASERCVLDATVTINVMSGSNNAHFAGTATIGVNGTSGALVSCSSQASTITTTSATTNIEVRVNITNASDVVAARQLLVDIT